MPGKTILAFSKSALRLWPSASFVPASHHAQLLTTVEPKSSFFRRTRITIAMQEIPTFLNSPCQMKLSVATTVMPCAIDAHVARCWENFYGDYLARRTPTMLARNFYSTIKSYPRDRSSDEIDSSVRKSS